MRPMNRRAAAGFGALAIATTLAVVPATAQSDAQGTTTTTTTTAPAAPTATTAAKPKRVRTKLRVRSVRRNVVAGRRILVRGALRPGKAGRVVKLQIRRGRRWTTVARTVTRRKGAFRVAYEARRIGTYKVRVRFGGDKTARASRRTVGKVNVYRRVLASWYGGGGAVACPGSSGRAALGVAHKTLPCGTMVTLHYRGRTVRAKVVDRGPFVAGREYDLTAATKNALGAGDLTTIMSTK